MQIGGIVRGGVVLISVTGLLGGSAAVAQSLPADRRPSPADGPASPAAGSLRRARFPVEPPGGRTESGAQGDQRPQAT